ncbi:hypothetical protein GSI_11043 [Ganoderma sinense ZZ0214-1]|uniref:Uncharacterized protein n=1 Tax=Ganoderma sinense ZZ0214-1 TaxID=1077348 RepID=A0A2G8RZB4_9APHY|nr:hypothetical protein GSI_11043 [Ganoderma sinense ZZ0214-1]
MLCASKAASLRAVAALRARPSATSSLSFSTSRAIRNRNVNVPPDGPFGVARALQASSTEPPESTLFAREFSLADRVALVSGAHRGIALEMALAFAEAGARAVYCVDLPKTPDENWVKVREYARALAAAGKTGGGEARLEYVCADVRDQDGMWKVGKTIGDREGRMDVFDVNVNGTLFTAQAAGQQMERFGTGGSIILIASISGHGANKGYPWMSYNTSKSAVLQMARSMACELGAKGIRVNSISPGSIGTTWVLTSYLLAYYITPALPDFKPSVSPRTLSMMSSNSHPAPPGPPPTVPSVLLPELLGFIPQFLLDDIINIANDEARQSVDAMEQFLQRWADARADKPPTSSSSTKDKDADWDPTQEIEQGLVAFQTLLESHVDVAFDFFEAWSMRNIFAVPADLPIVAPHQAGLDLAGAADQPERESELLAEIDELRRKVHAQRKLKRLFTRAVRKSAKDLEHSRTRLDRLAFLRAPQIHALHALPDELQAMYTSVSALPPVDELDPGSAAPTTEPGKRPWETSKTGYLNWAVGQLMERAKEKARDEQVGEDGAAFAEGSAEVGAAVSAAYGVGRAEDLKAVLESVGGDTGKGKDAERMDTRPG